MNQKLLAFGSCWVLGIGLFLANRANEAPYDSSADSRSSPATRNHPPSGSFSPSLKAKSPVEVTRLRLLEELAAIMRSHEPFDPGTFCSLLTELVEIDPGSAATFASSLDSGSWRKEALQRVSQIWTSKDAASAECWAASLADESERRAALTNVCVELAQSRAEAAVRLAESYGLEAHSGTLMETLAQQWANQDFSAAAAWVIAKPASEMREQMVMRLAYVQAATRPEEAARFVVQEIPDSPVQGEAVISVIYQWARRDLAGASKWVGLFPEGPLRERAESELANLAANQSQEQR